MTLLGPRGVLMASPSEGLELEASLDQKRAAFPVRQLTHSPAPPAVPPMSHPVIPVAKYSSQGKPGCRSGLAARPSSPRPRALPESHYLRDTFPKMQEKSGRGGPGKIQGPLPPGGLWDTLQGTKNRAGDFPLSRPQDEAAILLGRGLASLSQNGHDRPCPTSPGATPHPSAGAAQALGPQSHHIRKCLCLSGTASEQWLHSLPPPPPRPGHRPGHLPGRRGLGGGTREEPP